MSTQPTAAAMRAAEAVYRQALDKLGTTKVVGTLYHNDIAAAIIDAEIRPLVEALEALTRLTTHSGVSLRLAVHEQARAALTHATGGKTP